MLDAAYDGFGNLNQENALDRMRLLIVDDDLDMLSSLALMLSLEGYKVMTASSGPDAAALLEEHQFDVVITDLRMSIIDGFEIVCRTQNLHPEASIIVTSSYIDEDARAWMNDRGVAGLEKPYNVHQISAMLRDFQMQQI